MLKNYVTSPILCSMVEHNVKKKYINRMDGMLKRLDIGLDVSTLIVTECTEEELFLEVWDIEMFGENKCKFKPLRDMWMNKINVAIQEANAQT
jgi:hypothetical protein